MFLSRTSFLSGAGGNRESGGLSVREEMGGGRDDREGGGGVFNMGKKSMYI